MNADLVGETRERVTAVRATGAADDAGTTELEHDLLDVVARQTLLRRDLTPGHRPFVDPTGEMERTDEAVFGLSGDSHL